MAHLLCPKCETRGGMNYMKGVVTQEYNITTQVPQVTTWTCPYCGYIETIEEHFQAEGGTYNSGVAQGPAKEPETGLEPVPEPVI